MSINNVRLTCNYKLCLSCGICKAVCPLGAISINKGKPRVNRKCIECGKCLKHCPGISAHNSLTGCDGYDIVRGKIIDSYVGRSRDNRILRHSVSGGVLSTIVLDLLQRGEYDYAIGVGRPDFGILKMEIYDKDQFDKRFQKSVYTMPEYQDVISFLMEHKSKKIIIVGVGCIINSIKSIISSYNLSVDNYLFLGLFCGGTLKKSVEQYFRRYIKEKVIGFDYREKTNGWPGDIRFYCERKSISLPKEERQRIVKYFTNNRCLYCGNKLNVGADISVGDNYTWIHSDKLGSNTVIVRTKKGEQIINAVKEKLRLYEVELERVFYSQGIDDIIRHMDYGAILQKTKGIDINNIPISDVNNWKEIVREYKKEKKYIEIGSIYEYFPCLLELYAAMQGDTDIWNRLFIRYEEG